jgi:lipid-A-disaccharide synthase
MKRALKLMFLAGEASGDHHAAAVIKALKKASPGVQCFGLGGPAMQAAGMRLDYDLASHSVIGFFEVAKHLPALHKAEKLALNAMAQEQPDAVITVDYPGFNLRFSEKAHQAGFKTIHYISPQVWAWKAGRPRKMARYLDHMIVTFPFEKPLYDAVDQPCTFVGNPLVEAVCPSLGTQAVRRKKQWGNAVLVGLLPGSRLQEVHGLLPVMLKAARGMAAQRPGLCFKILKAPGLDYAHYEKALKGLSQGLDVQVLQAGPGEDPYALRQCFNFAMVASGTATLETALLGTPMVILYRVNPISYQIGKRLIRLPYIGLANVVAGKKVVPEFIQNDLVPERIAQESLSLLAAPQAQKRSLLAGLKSLGRPGCAQRAAAVIMKVAQKPSRFAKGD